MVAKKGYWYWIEYKSRSDKRAYFGPAKCANGMWQPYEKGYYQGFFILPSGEHCQFFDKDVIRKLDRKWVEENYPSYDELLRFWLNHG